MIEYVGVCGAAIILALFILNEWGRLSRESIWYDVGNAIGASLLALYAYHTNALPFLVLNVIWALVAWRDVIVSLSE